MNAEGAYPFGRNYSGSLNPVTNNSMKPSQIYLIVTNIFVAQSLEGWWLVGFSTIWAAMMVVAIVLESKNP